MRRLLFVIMIAAMMISQASAFNYTVGSYGYDFGQQFTVTASGSSGTLSGYQVAVNLSNSTGVSTATKLYTNGTSRVDWTDIVFTDGSNNPLNFWIENNTATATDAYAYVRVPSISTGGTTIRAYYGNASQLVSTMNGYSTFEAGSFDDFIGGSLNTTQFIQDGGSTRFSNGYIDFTGTKSYSLINTTATYGTNTSVVARAIFNTSGAATAYSYLGYGKWYVFPREVIQTYSTGTTANLQRVFVSNNSLYYDLSLDSRISTQSKYEVRRNALDKSVTILRNGSILNNTISGAGTRISTSDLHAEFAAYQYQSSMIVDWMFVKKYAIYEPTLSGFITVPLVSAPSASFTQNTTGGGIPLAVQFTDTSSRSPTAWQWTLIPYSNSTWLNFSTSQHPELTIAEVGNFSVMLTASNAYGVSNTSPVGAWVNTSLPALTAAYTPSANPVATGTNVSFNWSGVGTPILYDYGFGDGTANESTRNVSHKYSLPGTYYTFLNVSDAYGSYSIYTSSETVYNATGDYDQEIVMSPKFALTIHLTDSESGLPIAVTGTVTDTTNAVSNTTIAGTTTLFEDYSIVTGTIVAEGYIPRAFSVVVDSNMEVTYQLTPTTTISPNTNTVYTQHFVSFRIVDMHQKPIQLADINASYIASSLPTGGESSSFLQQAFGVSEAVALDMQNGSIAMSGQTTTDGTQTFVMFPALTYKLMVQNATQGVACQKTISPSDTAYAIQCPTNSQKNPNTTIAQTLNQSYVWVTEPNSSYVTFNSQYQDALAKTTNVRFIVRFASNNSILYQYDFGNPGSAKVLANYTMLNIRGLQMRAALNYTRSV